MRVTRLLRPAVFLGVAACAPAPTSVAPCDPDTAERRFEAPWHELSDAQLLTEIRLACGRVFVGVKEANAVRGVDPQGRNLTSTETVGRMKEYLAARGFQFEYEYDLPFVAGVMPVRLALVRELRRHPNIDYLEPSFPGTWLGR